MKFFKRLFNFRKIFTKSGVEVHISSNGTTSIKPSDAMKSAMNIFKLIPKSNTNQILEDFESKHLKIINILSELTVASCTCMTKTPTPSYHTDLCNYKRYCEIMELNIELRDLAFKLCTNL